MPAIADECRDFHFGLSIIEHLINFYSSAIVLPFICHSCSPHVAHGNERRSDSALLRNQKGRRLRRLKIVKLNNA